jgi:hypothetical protein
MSDHSVSDASRMVEIASTPIRSPLSSMIQVPIGQSTGEQHQNKATPFHLLAMGTFARAPQVHSQDTLQSGHPVRSQDPKR